MKPFIYSTSFGSITIGEHTYDYDVLIRANGNIEKRKKKLSKKIYGTSHRISPDEAEFIYEKGISKIIFGCGQYSALGLSIEAKDFFQRKQVSLILTDTRHAIREYNNEAAPCVGLFHVTC